MYKIFFIVIFTFLFFSCNFPKEIDKQVLKIDLSSNWKFTEKNDSIERSAQIPGSVHLDLLSHKLIPDPFYSDNEYKLQWISEKEWIYTKDFKLDSLKNYQNIELVFDGLDTYAKVFLNDSLLFYADNMFRKWSFPVQNILGKNNIIKIHFYNPDSINSYKQNHIPYKLPEIRAFTRKAPYQFGWDWGAKFLTVGIWKPVYLKFWENIKIDNIQILQNLEDSTNAVITSRIVTNSLIDKSYNIKIKNIENDKIYLDTTVLFKKGVNENSFKFSIKNPQLWWCNGLGEAFLYKLNISISDNKQEVDSKNLSIGLRTIDLVQEEDSTGKSFYFKLNGKNVFVKGANYVPQDQFLTRVDSNDYERLIESVIFANMNMLRVWGGGIYESDYFYNLCDKNGILLWQDFMFAGTMYPGDSVFIQSVENEIEEQIIRLRNHPSIALWCGNNEVSNAWFDWAWQKQFDYSTQDSLEMWNNYERLFHQLIPNLISKHDSIRDYWPSSPEFGWGHKENFTHGDSHYWGVWWGKEAFDIFNNKVGRFMSEYGFQSLPAMATIESFTPVTEMDVKSKSLMSHQKHPIGYETIDEYLLREYKKANNFDDYVYLSQLIQAEGIKTAIEAHRRAKPLCMGTLYWQLNDSWPVSSWSSIDYYYRKKALHYFVKEAYQETIISSIKNKNNLEIHLITDAYLDKNIKLTIEQSDFYGNILYNYEQNLILKSNSSQLAFSKKLELFEKPKDTFLHVRLWDRDSLVDEDFFYFTEIKNLQLPKATITYSIININSVEYLKIESDVLAKNIQIESTNSLSTNFFDLAPKTEKFIEITNNDNKLYNLKVLNNIYGL